VLYDSCQYLLRAEEIKTGHWASTTGEASLKASNPLIVPTFCSEGPKFDPPLFLEVIHLFDTHTPYWSGLLP